MSKLYLSEKAVARCFWSAINSSACKSEAQRDVNLISELSAAKVDMFPTEAGSVSVGNGVYLWLIAKYFSPKTVLEIGTYIGRSALALLFGGRLSISELYTCDGSYDCLNFSDYKNDMFEGDGGEIIDRIKYFGNTSSTDLLKKIHSEGKKLDLIFIDGRISPEDCQLFSQVMSPNCVFVLDDFEGIEKGVVNAIMLRNVFRGTMLIEPPVDNGDEIGNLALIVPTHIIKLSRQQNVPVNM